MKKTSVFIVLFVLLFCSMSFFVGCGKKDLESPKSEALFVREGNYVWFGEFPQSLQKKGVVINRTANSEGYYVGSDNERYVEHEGAYYKVEPLKWKILEEKDNKAFIVCETVIDASLFQDEMWIDIQTWYYGEYGDKTYQANDYRPSVLRKHMHDNIFEVAFTEEQKQKISVTYLEDVDAEVRVFPLSETELRNPAYGFLEDNAYDVNRIYYASDYAISKGVKIATREHLLSIGVSESAMHKYLNSATYYLRSMGSVSNHRHGNGADCSLRGIVAPVEVGGVLGVLPALYLLL